MLIKADSQPANFSVITHELHEVTELSQGRSTDRPILSSTAPYLYLIGAFAAFFATLYVTDWFWILPHTVLLFAAVAHLVIALKRRYPNFRQN